jgi:hypothetical protein
VIFTRAAAQAALPSLLGMAVDYKVSWDGHDARQKCGIITAAEISGQRLLVRGFVFARDFPEVEREALIRGDAMGMSYELADAHVLDMRQPVWTLTRRRLPIAAQASKSAHRANRRRRMNAVEKALETAGKDVLKVVESPVTLLIKTEKVLATAIKDQPLVKEVVVTLAKDGVAIAANLAAVIASKGISWTADLALVQEVESFFTSDILGKLVPVVEQVYGDIENDIETGA